MKHPYMGSEPLGLPLCMRSVDYSLLPVGAMSGRTLPGGRTYTQAAGSNQTEETVRTGLSTVARWAFVANTPRIGLLADGGIGLVLEPPRTNEAVQSRAMNTWTAGTATVTANAAAGPDGSIAAERVAATAGQYGPYLFISGLTSSSPYVFSLWVRRGVIGVASTHGFWEQDGTTAAIVATETGALADAWQRIANGVQTLGAATTGITVESVEGRAVGGLTAQARDAMIDFAQVEKGKYPTNALVNAASRVARAGFRLTLPVNTYVVGGAFRAQISHVPWADCTAYDGDSATVRLWTIDANTYAEINTTTRVLTVCVNGVSRVAAVPIWWLSGHRIEWYWRVGNGALFVRYRLSTDKGVSYTLPFDPFAGVQYTDAAISTSATSLDLWSDGGSSKWFGTGACKEDFLYTAPAWALQALPTDVASVKAHLRGDAAYTLSAGTVSAVGSQGATGGLGWAQATGANQPSVATSGGKTYLSFDGSNDYLNGAAASSYAGASAKTVWIVAKIRNVTLNGAASYNNHMLVGDGGAGALWGVYAKVGPLAIGYNWDGTDDGVTTSVGLAAWTWLRYRHDGATVYLSVAGGAEVTVASGATSSMAGVLSVGGRVSGAWAPIDVQDVIVANSATVGQQAAIDAYCAQRAA